MAISTYNSSFPSMNTTKTTNDKIQIDEAQGIAMAVINVLIAFIGTFGNILIITAVLKTPQLRKKPSNNLILSLAVADLIVTVISQPLFATSMLIKMINKTCIVSAEVAYLVAIAFSGCSSTLHLAAISIDRAISVVKPHRHRDLMRKWSKVMVYVCWGAAIAYGSLLVKFPEVKIASYISLVSCFAIMICSYGIILYKLKMPNSVSTEASNARERALEKRVSGTVAIVILLYAVCWFPLVVYNLYHPKHIEMCSRDLKVSWIHSLLLANSSMNFFVYSLRIRQFRGAFVRLICRLIPGARKITALCLRDSNETDGGATTLYVKPIGSLEQKQ